MSKTIRLEDQVHRELEELKLKRETFSDTVGRLVKLHRDLTRIVWSSSGQHPSTPAEGR